MELDFQKEKQKYADLSDADLVGRLRDPDASATQRMLIEAEIARRGIDRHNFRAAAPEERPTPKIVRRGSSMFSTLVIVVIVFSVISGVLEELGVDLIELAREFFGGDQGTTEMLPPPRP